VTTNARAKASSLHGNFQASLFCCFLATFAAGCADDGGESPESCVNPDTPIILTVKDVLPEPDSAVPNQDIVHTFTVVDATGTFSELTFGHGNGHTAEIPSPEPMVFSSAAFGTDVVYTFEPVVWTKTGHVELVELGAFSDTERCFILPRPLFSYDVVP
jgi:hypothetical protein